MNHNTHYFLYSSLELYKIYNIYNTFDNTDVINNKIGPYVIMDKKLDLENIDCSKVLKFSLDGEVYDAKVVSVYDGDTVNAVFLFNNKLNKWACRLDGLDTPELRTSDEKEKEVAIMVRDKLREKILNKVVKLECKKFDKFGRLLVDIYYNDLKINDWLIENKYAVKYSGGKKKEWNFE